MTVLAMPTTALMLLVCHQEGQSSSYLIGTSGCTPPTYINHHDNIPRGFESEVFTGKMLCLSLNQQLQKH